MRIIERYKEGFEIQPNAYRISYNEEINKFEISFAKRNRDEVFIHSNTILSPEDFKVIFHSMLDSMVDYCKKENPKFLEECIGEYTEK